MKSANDRDFKIFVFMLLALIIPTALTLRTVVHPVEITATSSNPMPLGYTWSQLFFAFPAALLFLWFRRHPHYGTFSRPFWLTIGAFTLAGMGLDIFLGNTFFVYSYPGSIVGLYLPGWDFAEGWLWNIPLEEITFYSLGIVFMLLFYIFGDLYWFGEKSNEEHVAAVSKVTKILRPHWHSAVWALVIEAAAIAYHVFVFQGSGFPGYFTVLNFGFIAVTFAFFRVVKPFVNWRALSFSVLTMVLISLIYEVTLALPYGLWEYHHDWMIGIFIGPWNDLPIEEPLLWSISSWGAVLVYEVLRIHYVKKREAAVPS